MKHGARLNKKEYLLFLEKEKRRCLFCRRPLIKQQGMCSSCYGAIANNNLTAIIDIYLKRRREANLRQNKNGT